MFQKDRKPERQNNKMTKTEIEGMTKRQNDGETVNLLCEAYCIFIKLKSN